jgi:hypothetical protein
MSYALSPCAPRSHSVMGAELADDAAGRLHRAERQYGVNTKAGSGWSDILATLHIPAAAPQG